MPNPRAGFGRTAIRRGHYELGVDADPKQQLPAAFAELASAIGSRLQPDLPRPHFVNATAPPPVLSNHRNDTRLRHCPIRCDEREAQLCRSGENEPIERVG